jgi:hypothetical protein
MKIPQKRPHKKFIEQKAYINSNKNIEITEKKIIKRWNWW